MDWEEITLYDENTNRIMEIKLSKVDADRAKTDIVFATTIMNAALRDEQVEQVDTATDENGELPDKSDNEACNTISTVDTIGEGIYRWTTPCIELLLHSYRDLEGKIQSGKYSHKSVWEEISQILKNSHYIVTGPQCAAKLRSLKKTYKAVKDHNNKSGNNRRTWQYYEIMDEIFSKKAWCSPISLASSSGLSTINTNDSDSGNSYNASTSKITPTKLLARKLEQKEEHARQKMRRHEERMEMDRELLNVLKELLPTKKN
ncbi:hypothetical protein FQR65_LT14041 [Abscondita terminalis]|nr:hypothetical protein FQR65_LT14041 [Abscondita terminalis]